MSNVELARTLPWRENALLGERENALLGERENALLGEQEKNVP